MQEAFGSPRRLPREYLNHSPPPLAPGCVGFCQWEARVGDQRVGGERPALSIGPRWSHRISPSKAQLQLPRTTPPLAPFS